MTEAEITSEPVSGMSGDRLACFDEVCSRLDCVIYDHFAEHLDMPVSVKLDSVAYRIYMMRAIAVIDENYRRELLDEWLDYKAGKGELPALDYNGVLLEVAGD